MLSLLIWLIIITEYTSLRFNVHRSTKISKLIRFANPVNSDGNNLRNSREEDAFLWFDEACIYVRGGSGGAGSSAVKFGKARQHIASTGGSGK
jgi:hypothetical protein